MLSKALFYQTHGKDVVCNLCPHHCFIKEGDFGKCHVRLNKEGILYSTNYGEVTSLSVDPIEKKPLYHFHPGTNILSFGSYGCNFSCTFCQNWRISQGHPHSDFIPPGKLLEYLNQGHAGIAFTYNEPTVFYEYILDTVKQIKDQYVVLVTNGFIEKEPLEQLLPYIDAMNIDLKAYNKNYYQEVCGGRLDPVLETIKNSYQLTHVEITTLMVTDLVTLEDIDSIASFLGSLSREIPLHISRYFPNYHLNNHPTDVSLLIEAKKVAERYLDYVYIGNTLEDSNTYCPQCHKLLIERSGYETTCFLDSKFCTCGKEIPIILK